MKKEKSITMWDEAYLQLQQNNWDGSRENAQEITDSDGMTLDSIIAYANQQLNIEKEKSITMWDEAYLQLLQNNWDGSRENAQEISDSNGVTLDSIVAYANQQLKMENENSDLQEN